jgi:hypothetical protein
VSTATALAYGSAGHEVQDAYYSFILAAGNSLRAQKAARKEAVIVAEEAFDLLEFKQPDNRADLHDTLFNTYFPNEPYVSKSYRVVAVEKRYSLEYDEELKLRYPFIVDLVVVDPDGKTVVVDHKFVYEFYSMDATRLMSQIPKYIGALRALNHKVDYGEYNMIRSRKIKAPTAEQSMQQLPVKPSNVRVVRTFLEHTRIAKELQALKELEPELVEQLSYRTDNSMTCRNCDFSDLCAMQLDGANTKLLLATEFEVRERGDEFEVSEDA